MIVPIFIGNVDKRKHILETTTPLSQREVRKMRITESSGEFCLKQFANKKISDDNIRYIFTVLENANSISESYGTKIARYISKNIIPNIDNNIDIDELYSLVQSVPSKQQIDILTESIGVTLSYDRILKNQDILSRRFNIDKYVHENLYRYNITPIVNELCSMIDTYSMSTPAKYYIALENVLYSLYKNGVIIEDKNAVAESVTDYFLSRDRKIPDKVYKAYQKILSENKYYTPKNNSLLTAVLNNHGSYYSDKIEVLKEHTANKQVFQCLSEISNIESEDDVLSYIDSAYNIISNESLSLSDRGLLYESIELLPSITGIPDTFVNIKKEKLYDDINDVNKCLSSIDSILNPDEAIVEKYSAKDYLDKLLETSDYISSDDVKDILNKFKAEQEKTVPKFKQMINKLYSKRPEDIIDNLPSLFTIIRKLTIVGVAAVSPIGPIIAIIIGLIDWLIDKNINDSQTEKLLKYLKDERKTIKDKIDNEEDDKKKKELEEYLQKLNATITKVQRYAETISDKVDDEDDDESLDDLDFNFESAEIAMNRMYTISESANSCIDYYNEQYTNSEFSKSFSETPNIKDIVIGIAKNGLLEDFTDIIKASSVNINEYAIVLNTIYRDTNTTPNISYAIGLQRKRLEESTDLSPIKQVLTEAVANEAVEQIIQEKFDLNSVKLIMQNAKRKLKDLNTKQKSMWQSVDAAGSGLVKSIERALTSDRREAIIKGNIIPSFSKCIKGSIALAAIGVFWSPGAAIIAAIGAFGASSLLNAREKKLLIDEIDTELKVVEKQIEISQNDGDMNQYRFLLNYQKKLTREMQRIKYGLKVTGRDIPRATLPSK